MSRKITSMNRRQFLVSSAVIAGGLSLQLRSGDTRAGHHLGAQLSPWLQIYPDDRIIVTVPTPEIGNGATTQHAMNIAEELECDWDQIELAYADYREELKSPGSFAVGSTPFFSGHGTDHDRMFYALQLGASARERLKNAAASRWGCTVAEVRVENSVLIHDASGRRLRYGEVAADAAAIQLSEEPAIKTQAQWTRLGKLSPSKLQAAQVVRGTATFGLDVQQPGMVHAALKQSPIHGGQVVSFDAEAVRSMPGVRAVFTLDPNDTPGSPVPVQSTFGLADSVLRSAVVVVADHYWQAKKALDALPVVWDDGLGAFWRDNALLQERQEQVLQREAGAVLTRAGAQQFPETGQQVEAIYHTPFCEHATLEPLNGTALYRDDGLSVWHPAQDLSQAFWVAVDESGLQPEQVSVHQTLVGGGFGRRTMSDDLRVVVAVARQYPGVPVKVIWSREETTQQGAYRTAISGRYRAALGHDGMPAALHAEACFSGLQLNLGFTDMPYAAAGNIPSLRLAVSELPTHVVTGAYRAPCFNSHAFMVETFIDECAVAAGQDPVDYRLRLLGDWSPAWSQCLRVAAEKIGWDTPVPAGHGRGIAISNWPYSGSPDAGATTCVAVEVSVSDDDVLTIHRIECAFDCGRVVNRNAVEAQLEGGLIFGLNMTLNEGLTLRDGAIEETNFHQLPMLTLKDIPPMTIHWDALSGHDRFAIIGEAPVGSIGPALGNAIFQATGRRLRSTPFLRQGLTLAQS